MMGMTMTDEAGRMAVEALENLKAQDIVTIDVTALSDVMDNLIVATGTSNRHVKSLAANVVDELKKQGLQPIGIEGMDSSDWVLVDYGTAVVHVMLPQTRQFYDLEKLWSPLGRGDNSENPQFI
ncbi:MAG: ribosome-associated protein [Candidatus Endobugula sp.]|jgi:ribosome-associated protein